ncbi:hypothetical protein BD413DRAFT_263986 [Trametes elegans]|nr:hypothetical protein BD413DRAFT_263986 [Trametes elegans]
MDAVRLYSMTCNRSVQIRARAQGGVGSRRTIARQGDAHHGVWLLRERRGRTDGYGRHHYRRDNTDMKSPEGSRGMARRVEGRRPGVHRTACSSRETSPRGPASRKDGIAVPQEQSREGG